MPMDIWMIPMIMGALHLHAVVELQLVFGFRPPRIDAKSHNGHGTHIGLAIGGEFGCTIPLGPMGGNSGHEYPARKHLRGEAKHVVVQQPDVNSEKAHQKQQVAAAKNHSEDLVEWLSLQVRLEVDQERGEDRHDEAVTNIPVHDTEQIRERDDREHAWVDLLVARGGVRVDDPLEARSELV